MNEIPKMLPCPFCGGVPFYNERDDQFSWIACSKCECEGPSIRDEMKTKEERLRALIKKWNRRTDSRVSVTQENK